MKSTSCLSTLARRSLGSLLLAAALAAQAQNPVTFQVDMSVKTAEGVFVPGSYPVTARGSFNGWGSSFQLEPSPTNPALYVGTVDVGGTQGGTVYFKFVYNDGADRWETRGDRSFTIAGGAQTLPVAYYDDDSVISVMTTTPVTFRVNMGVKIAEGTFDPANHTLSARGSFNSWSPGFDLAPSAADTNIYTGTLDITDLSGSTLLYKFVINDGADRWESDPNRSFVLDLAAMTLPVDYFDRDSVVSLSLKAAIAFEVDLSVQMAAGNFDRASDEVWVRGNRMGWGNPASGFQLFEDTTRPGIYTNVYTMDAEMSGTTVEFKYTLWRTSNNTTVWEDGNNKTLSFNGSEPLNPAGYHLITLPKTFFNNISASDILTSDTVVTFSVNMSAAKNSDGSPFDPATQGVWLNGNFIPWWGWASLPPEYQMLDDGTGGDAVAGDKIYTLRQTLLRGTNTRADYKYGMDSNDNEAGFGQNHVRYIRTSGTYAMPVDTFGVMTAEPEVGSLTVSAPSGGSVTISWNGRTGVRLQSCATLGGTWTDVAGTDGQSSKVIAAGSGQQFFRLVK
jgi:hypothetical protein